MDDKSVENIGKWSFRIILTIGAIVCGAIGSDDIAQACIFALVLSFLFL
jgi:hypothetical protein